MKILCVCHAGAVRSVAMADILRQEFKQDAVPIAWAYSTDETWELLCSWADMILIVEEYQRARVSDIHRTKMRLVPLGTDVWGNAHHPDLRARLPAMLKEVLR